MVVEGVAGGGRVGVVVGFVGVVVAAAEKLLEGGRMPVLLRLVGVGCWEEEDLEERRERRGSEFLR